MRYLIIILICFTFSLQSEEKSTEKTKEELKQERDEHIKEGTIDAGLASVAATGAVISAASGHTTLAVAEGAAAVVEATKSVDEFKQAYDCHKKMKEKDKQELELEEEEED